MSLPPLKDTKEFQKRFLDQIKSRIGGEEILASHLSMTLGIGLNAAYKKVQQTTLLSLNDIILLSKAYQISVDQLLPFDFSPIPFLADGVRRQPESYSDYFVNIKNHLEKLIYLKDVKFINLSGEAPLFHFLLFPKLLSFKLYAWNFTSWMLDKYKRELDLSIVDRDTELKANVEDCLKIYYRFEGIEIWNSRMLDITMDQIKYFIQLRKFKNRHEVMELVNSVYDMADHLSNITSMGIKKAETNQYLSKAKVEVYLNELVYSSDVFYVFSRDVEAVFINYNPPNLIRTTDKRFAGYTKNWLTETLKHSSLISKEGELERSELNHTMNTKLDRAKKEIEGLLILKYPS